MDGRITALRVGFLSSSHQLAGLNFLLPALLNATQGLHPFIGVFALFSSPEFGSVSGRFGSGGLARFFSAVVLRGFGQASRRCDGCAAVPSSFRKKCFRLILHGCFFPPV